MKVSWSILLTYLTLFSDSTFLCDKHFHKKKVIQQIGILFFNFTKRKNINKKQHSSWYFLGFYIKEKTDFPYISIITSEIIFVGLYRNEWKYKLFKYVLQNVRPVGWRFTFPSFVVSLLSVSFMFVFFPNYFSTSSRFESDVALFFDTKKNQEIR